MKGELLLARRATNRHYYYLPGVSQIKRNESTTECVSSLTASRKADMCVCVCAESLEVEVTIKHQLLVHWLERSLIMTEYLGSIPEISDH
jgi:hypothetical protein